MREIEGVICDMDGTIVESEDLHLKAWNMAIENHGCTPPSADWSNDCIGLPDRICLDMVYKLFPRLADAGDILEEKQLIFREMARERGANLSHQGIRERLGRLRDAGVKLAVATNSEMPNTRAVLQAAGLTEFFPVIITSDMVGKGKPHPDIYLSAAYGLGLPPSRCAAIEDSVAGLESARAAGCAVLGVTNTWPAEKLKPVDLVFDSTHAALDWALSNRAVLGCAPSNGATLDRVLSNKLEHA